MKSSEKHGRQILGVMPEKRAIAFLLDCANLQHGPESREAEFRRLSHLYADVIPRPVLYTHQLQLSSAFGFLSLLLQRGWASPTEREREWFFREAEVFSRNVMAKDVDRATWGDGLTELHFVKPPAQPNPLEAVFHYLWRNEKHALRCANPACITPYFFAKKGQKFCSPECAGPARRASKLKWWNENRADKPKTQKGTQTKTKKGR